jgi:hypothetical protein
LFGFHNSFAIPYFALMFETGSNLSTASVVAAAVDGAGAVKSTTNTLHPPPPQNSFMCDVCKVTTNSPQQLHMHFIGLMHMMIKCFG